MMALTTTRLGLLALTLTASAGASTPLSARPQDGGTAQQLLAAVHVHSSASSGAYPLTELARVARQSGVDVVVLAENLGYDFRYAPAGARFFVEARMPLPTLERYGIDRFLRELDAARRSEPEVLLLAGVEVPPYYYWTGSLLRGDLTLNDAQRNLLLVPNAGDDASRAAAFFRGIPAVGNRHHRRYGLRSLLLALPGAACLALSIRLLAGARTGGPRRRLWPAAASLVAGTLLLSVNFPFAAPRIDPYEPSAADRVATEVLAYASSSGALSFWSMPEAVDFQERGFGLLTVGLSTPSYSGVLAATPDYTGFGGVYADTVTSWEPGGEWDRALASFRSGERAAPPWIIGESAFHASGHAGKRIGDVLTVLFVDERTEQAVFAALSAGRSYAVRRDPGHPDLRLADYSVHALDAVTAGRLRTAARSGETLPVTAAGPVDLEVSVRVEEAHGEHTDVTVDLVRDGELIRQVEGRTPLVSRWRETLAAADAHVYYRVVARSTRAAYLVTNPIFVERRQ